MYFLRTALLFLFLAVVGVTAYSAAEKTEKVVYHITDSANATALLNNVRNHLEANPKAQIVVVAHGGGVDFLLEDA